MRILCTTAEQRFWAKVQISDRCWLWLAGLTPAGYGKFWLDGETVLAHRVAYELIKGPIPDGLTLDHVCRIRRCVRPDEEHCDPATQRINTLRSPIAPAAINARKTHCAQGHPFDRSNTYHTAKGHRMCRTCCRIRTLLRQRAAGAVPRHFTTRPQACAS